MPARLALLLGLGALLAYRGGLHAWQLLLGALLLGAAQFAAPQPRLSRNEAWAVTAACWLGLLGLSRAWDPQAHLNAWALALGAATVFMLARREAAWDERRALLWVAGIGATLSALFVLLGALGALGGSPDAVGGWLMRPHISSRWLAPNQNLLAGAWSVPAFLAAMALLFQGRRWAWAVALAAGAAILYAGSRGALLALMAGLAAFALRVGWRPRLWAGLAVAGLLMLGLVAFAPISWLAERVRIEQAPVHEEKDPQLFRRREFWARSAEASLQAPLLGRGLGAFPLVARQFDLPVPLSDRQPIARYRLDLEHAHNEWLTMAVELGWPATLGLLMALAAMAWTRWRKGAVQAGTAALEAGLVAGLVVSLVDMNLRAPGILAAYALTAAALLPRQDPGQRPTWPWRGSAAMWLLLAAGLWAGRQAESAMRKGLAAAWTLAPASVLQPLDAGIQARRAQLGLGTWAWASWCGRRRSEWLWQAAAMRGQAGDLKGAYTLSKAAVDARPFWAPGWHWLGERSAYLGRDDDAQAQWAQALKLEPNFSRVLALQCDRLLAQKKSAEARTLLRSINAIQKLQVKREEPDAYTLYIQAVDPVWLEKRNKELGLSTVSRLKS